MWTLAGCASTIAGTHTTDRLSPTYRPIIPASASSCSAASTFRAVIDRSPNATNEWIIGTLPVTRPSRSVRIQSSR